MESVVIVNRLPPDVYATSFLVPDGGQLQGDQTALAR